MPLYWERCPDGPFVTLIGVTSTYLHPENYCPEGLAVLAKLEDDPEMRVFKAELRRAMSDPSLLPGDELWRAVQYDEDSPAAFLRQLWRDLYGSEDPEAAG